MRFPLFLTPSMREHLLCPSTEGCHVIARPWHGPLGDFAVLEFLALYGLFCPDERDICPMGNAMEVEQARVRLRRAVGPVAIKTRLTETTATEIGKRLVTGTLHEILCEGRGEGEVREAIVGLGMEKTNNNLRPHALLLQFPGETSNSTNPLLNYGAKRRKQFLNACIQHTWLDPNGDDETNGCGGRENMETNTIKQRRPHVCVLWSEHRQTFCVTKPVCPEFAIEFVRKCALSHYDNNTQTNRGYEAAPPTPALAAVIANLAQITEGKVTLDPFCGTCGLLLPALVLGAPTAIGVDVTPLVVGDGSTGNGNRSKSIEIITGNVFSLPARRSDTFKVDAIVCDPPYGLRAPRICVTNAKDELVVDAVAMTSATLGFMDPVFKFAGCANGLAKGGRIVFLQPTHWSKDESESEFAHGDVGSDLARRKLRRENTDLDSDNTQALHPSLKLIGTCAQEFKAMTRRAVVYVKTE